MRTARTHWGLTRFCLPPWWGHCAGCVCPLVVKYGAGLVVASNW